MKTVLAILAVGLVSACGDVAYYPAPGSGTDAGAADAADPGCTSEDECGGYLCAIGDGERTGECLTACTNSGDVIVPCANEYRCDFGACAAVD
jgi:hypothetical protein